MALARFAFRKKLGLNTIPAFVRNCSGVSGDYVSMETKQNGVAIVTLDDKSSKVNTLSEKMTTEIAKMLDTVENDSNIKSVVLKSGKPGCFIAGADIGQLRACKTEEEVKNLSKHGQQFLKRVADSKKPFVAAIDGSCMGGGLEVALACHYRIATESKKTVLSLPEVMLGLLPGAGGTQRLPRLVGLEQSLTMMLQGSAVKPAKAKRMGLVDGLADPNQLEHAAILAAQGLVDGSVKSKKKKQSWKDWFVNATPVGRNMAISMASKTVAKKTGGHYPAPEMILDAVKTGLEQGFDKGQEKESSNFAKLGMTSEAKALMSIFFGQTELKKNRYGKPDRPVNTMAVIGAGLMGAGIAQVSAQKGVRVLLKDQNASAASKGEKTIADDMNGRVKKRRMTAFEKDEIMARVVPLSDEDEVWKKHMGQADLVIEAVFEDMKLKHKVIQDIEQYTPDHCIIATNTSALSVADIASASKRPENVIAMHYFSPVPKMPLLEIIRHEKTSDQVAAAAVDLGIRQGKTCIVVKDVPGFYVNRCLGPFISETLALVQDGVGVEYLDNLVKKWGMPVGPITLADEVGVDVAYHVNETLSKALGVRMQGGNASIFSDMVDKGFLGRKSGKGFFNHPASKKEKRSINAEALELVKKYQTKDLKLDDETIINRLMSRFVNEAVLCVQDEIIASPSEGDMGAVFGVGFPPFIGGPFRFVDSIGSTKYTEMMQGFADKYGEQFTPCELLQDMAKTNKKFHSS